jgi:DNA-binding transcriptional LysR family regulator
MIPALSDFYQNYPDIEIDLRIGYRHADLIAESVDCAIRAADLVDESLVAKRVGEFRFVTCASPKYLRRHGTPTTPGDLEKDHHTIGMGYASTRRPLTFVFLKDTKRIEMEPRHLLSVNDTNAYLAAGLAGLGIIQAPRYAVQSAIVDGQLRPILEDWQTEAIPVHIVFPSNRFLSAKVRVFIDWTVALFEHNVALRSE